VGRGGLVGRRPWPGAAPGGGEGRGGEGGGAGSSGRGGDAQAPAPAGVLGGSSGPALACHRLRPSTPQNTLAAAPHPPIPPQKKVLPDEIGCLARLRTLRVRSNRLAALPAALGRCSALVELHAGFNALRELPEGLGAVRGLAVLEVRNNHIAVRPPGWGGRRGAQGAGGGRIWAWGWRRGWEVR
jgi:hypothetical protein